MGSQTESAAAGAAMGELNTRKQLAIAQQQTAALDKQVMAMNRQLALSTAAQIPFVFLKDMPQQTEDLHGDSIVKWSGVWHNSGGSKPIKLKVWNDCTDFMTTAPIKFHRKVAPLFSLVLGPGADRTMSGCEALYSYLKQIDDENIARAQARDDTRRQFYVFGGAEYKDFLGHRHIVEYCYQLWWDNRSLKFGFQLIPCSKPNEQYNCTDEECKDWNQKPN